MSDEFNLWSTKAVSGNMKSINKFAGLTLFSINVPLEIDWG
ncbi:hypothetical protein HMPREF0662_00899 [Prevotella nigrescens F0103]|nr:hypothetical protein HMPREF0662_00899 [Prevotella nigrescens F0103]